MPLAYRIHDQDSQKQNQKACKRREKTRRWGTSAGSPVWEDILGTGSKRGDPMGYIQPIVNICKTIAISGAGE